MASKGRMVRIVPNYSAFRKRNCSRIRVELGSVSAIDSNGRTIWIADAHHDDEKRFVVHADEKLTGFLELESTIRAGIHGAIISP